MRSSASKDWNMLVLLSLVLHMVCGFCNAKAPHIIFVVADDLGWNDVSFHGSFEIPTPNIDILAQTGFVLNNYYVQPLCTPSRGSLMTGKYPIHLGLQHNVIYANAPWGLSPNETILPQHLKKLGYKTHGIGKWHLGFLSDDYLPVNRGFDSFFGYWTGKEDFYTHFEELQGMDGLDFHDDNENAWNYDGYYSTELFTEKAKNIVINHNTSEPLFLYVAHQAVHTGNSYSPLQAPMEYVQKFSHIKDPERRIFAGMVSALDFSVGEIFKALKKTNMLENCIFVFTTDNGAAVRGIDDSTGSNWPLRGSKYNMWEGGIRGVAFLWSPFIEKKVSNNMMHISDWLPTLYSVAGGNIKDLGNIDGYNMWPSFCCDKLSPRTEILHNIDPYWKVEAIRRGKYKLIKGSVFDGKFDGWFDKEGKKMKGYSYLDREDSTYYLYQLYYEHIKESHVAAILFDKYFNTSSVLTSDVCRSGKQYINSISMEKNDIEELLLQFMLDNWKDFKVNCGIKPKNAAYNCKPTIKACLFDVENDPCEYYNLADSQIQIVRELEDSLNIYRKQAAPIRNMPGDSKANPKFHNYAWIPWKTA